MGFNIKYYVKASRTLFRLQTALRYRYSQIKHKNPAHPYKILFIDPSEIRHRCYEFTKWRGLGQISGGTWDIIPIEEQEVYVGLVQRFKKEYDWENTNYYEFLYEQEKSHENIIKYLNFIDKLYEEISNSGYIPNYTRLKNNDYSFTNKYYSLLEPLICIDKKGEMYLRDGAHRFVISKILGIRIPVYVIGRHKKWQKERDSFNKNGSPIANICNKMNHCDLDDIRNNNIYIEKPI